MMDQPIEQLIKSKQRVQKHGEVFTPAWMVKKMIETEGIREACENLTATFLEPAAGEGNFLIAILMKKLEMVEREYGKTLQQFEQFSLLVLSTLYGIELLEDNAQMCVMNMFEVFSDYYTQVVTNFDQSKNPDVIKSAKVIIKANIAQGNFLTRKIETGEPIIFSEWGSINELAASTEQITINRTEYTLDEIYNGVDRESGVMYKKETGNKQLNLFDLFNEQLEVEQEPYYRYKPVNITQIYKEEVEEYEL